MIHKFYIGQVIDCLRRIESESVQCCVTSPPYWGLRDYGAEGQIGLEKTPEEYISKLGEVFREVRRVLRKDGTAWINLGDSYAKTESNNGGYSNKSTLSGFTRPDTKGRIANETGKTQRIKSNLESKNLVGIPWRVALALQADGWFLRSDIIWSKPNPMPESVTDRPTKAHEYLFLLAKSQRYYYDAEVIKEPGTTTRPELLEFGPRPDKDYPGHINDRRRKKTDNHPSRTVTGFNDRWDAKEASGEISQTRNKRSVWEIATEPYPGAHFAVMPTKLVEPCILAGSKKGDIILDPFGGSGTVSLVSQWHQRSSIYIDLNPKYLPLALERNGFNGLCHADTFEIIEMEAIPNV
jgi:DNA modification methylase